MAFYWCSLIVLVWIGAKDWQQRRITNVSLLILAFPGVVYVGSFGGPTWQQVGLNVLIGLALTLPGYVRGAVGGGDVKLMIAIAPLWPPFTLLIIFAAGTVATVLILQLFRFVERFADRAKGDDAPPIVGATYDHIATCAQTPSGNSASGLPLGSAIALGALLMHAGTTLYPSLSGLT